MKYNSRTLGSTMNHKIKILILSRKSWRMFLGFPEGWILKSRWVEKNWGVHIWVRWIQKEKRRKYLVGQRISRSLGDCETGMSGGSDGLGSFIHTLEGPGLLTNIWTETSHDLIQQVGTCYRQSSEQGEETIEANHDPGNLGRRQSLRRQIFSRGIW